MRGEKGEKKFSYSITIWNVFIFIAIVVTSIYRLSYAYGAIENDMLKLGQKIVLSYSVEQSGEFYIYERLINFSDEYLKNLKKNNEAFGMAAFNNLFYYVDSAVAGGIIHPYIVADDSVYTVCEDDKKALGDFENSKWYKRALEADGDTVYVNTYNDMAPSDVNIIIAKKSWDNNVVAFGVNLKGQYEYIKSEDMPEGNVTKLRLIETKPLQKRLEKFSIYNLFHSKSNTKGL